jgi:hypothetical protein
VDLGRTVEELAGHRGERRGVDVMRHADPGRRGRGRVRVNRFDPHLAGRQFRVRVDEHDRVRRREIDRQLGRELLRPEDSQPPRLHRGNETRVGFESLDDRETDPVVCTEDVAEAHHEAACLGAATGRRHR